MLNQVSEKALARVIAYGSALVTVFLVSGSVTDPVNTPKLLLLGIVAGLSLGYLLVSPATQQIKSNPLIWVVATLFLLASLVSVFMSKSPLSQNIYGSYGRNNGLLAYLFLSLILLASTSLQLKSSFNLLIFSLLTAGMINVLYCLWVITFGDFIGWQNPYGNILGTFGNPNFIGAYLGIFISAYLGYGLSNQAPKWFKYSMLVVLPVAIFEIFDSNAIQGRVVGAGGVAIVGFFYLRARVKAVFVGIYSALCVILGTIAALGALQIGPLESIIYKTSVSLRGQYWLAGWNTGKENPFHGVGMDAFGDWYRRSRDIHALDVPGVNTVVNAAHNVPLDMFAFGGWPLLVTYLAIMTLGGWSLLKLIVRTRSYDPVVVVLTSGWVGYQVQSLISINQIGLAIWGWVLTGAAIAYERQSRTHNFETTPEMKRRKSVNMDHQAIRGLITATCMALFFLILSIPPFTSDMKWRSAQVGRTLTTLEDSMNADYFNPQNVTKYQINIQILEQSNFSELAGKYAREAVRWNPESFELWKTLYLISESTPQEKAQALENMKRLDPLNPDVTSIA